jgi:secreted PhoX family phosphatase
VLEGGDDDEGQVVNFAQPHGYIFEVPASGIAVPTPLKAMGRFVHEALAVDPATSIVYETEDRGKSGFYRFVPETPKQLARGGRLEMLKVPGAPDLISGAELGRTYDVAWVPIEDPERRHSPGTQDEGGVFEQGHAQGGSPFARLEGCWWGDGACYFVATSGGRAKAGQIWRYEPAKETLRLVFESPSSDVLDAPDNITVSPRGGLVLCEDGDRSPQKLQALSPSGVLTQLAWNNIQLNGERNRFSGDFRGSEWAGATFSPDGEWLFVNIQSPGVTFAITGPWESVGL